MKTVLHVISDRNRHRLPLLQALSKAAEGGADVIQIREKKAPAAETYGMILELQQQLRLHGLATKVFVNDRADIGIAAELDGVHLAAKSLPIQVVKQLRMQTGWSGLIGCSIHALDEAVAAEQAGVDYVTFGHVYASESHPGLAPRGLQSLHRVVDALSIPVIAIGGIDRANVGAVLDTGCSGIAVIGAVLDAQDPLVATRQLKDEMEKSRTHPKIPFRLPSFPQS
ncbi:thiamine phosphate synthase [Alicyclobacillus mengziensis]|uniref:Thiamine-phosphate synthase n=1 Tax=Alicyclobacillus mengziensis TaxID=2931921 RepID=A0A9X7Z7W8_9BACL|nr:thiamine phosphate synthase [Alicyclobacillus mengziensis]QSO47810.1 thiamine phosphate synthase [Alicyclobacillus mengziensis]